MIKDYFGEELCTRDAVIFTYSEARGFVQGIITAIHDDDRKLKVVFRSPQSEYEEVRYLYGHQVIKVREN